MYKLFLHEPLVPNYLHCAAELGGVSGLSLEILKPLIRHFNSLV